MRRMTQSLARLAVAPLVALSALACAAPPAAKNLQEPTPARTPGKLQKLPDGVFLGVAQGTLKLEVCAANIVRVMFARDTAFFSRKTLATEARRCDTAGFELSQDATTATLATPELRVRVDLGTGRVSFSNAAGEPVLEESESGRTLMPAIVMGEKTSHVGQKWLPHSGEALYGLGENQIGLFDLKGHDLDLWQHNGTIVVPFLVSSRGWGVLWDNTSFTRFGDLRQLEPIPAERLLDAEGKPGGLTGSYYSGGNFETLMGKRVDRTIDIQLPQREKKSNSLIYQGLPEGPASVRWEGALEPDITGDHTLQAYYNGDFKLWVDDRLVINHWRQFWLPWKDEASVFLEAGRRHKIRIEWIKDATQETVQLKWKPPAPNRASKPASTSLWSEVGAGIDYTFVYGPELDDVVAGYRLVTGTAPMIPRWALGLWQSRQRYRTAEQSLDVVDGFRKRGIPFDNIVQDWFYWKEDSWGSHEFDPKRFPDPDKWVRDIHAKHARVMISVWPKFYPGTRNFEQMRTRGFLYRRVLAEGIRDWVGDEGYPYTFYDAFSADAGKLFWGQIEKALYGKGFDAWWLDATEPDLTREPTLERQRQYVHPTALGTGARMLNAYALYNARAVYDGQRAAAPNRRVFILTRSAFAGLQRYGAAVWSGDITSTWTALRSQIPAGLSMSLSGIPYWSMDVGGFSVPARFSTHEPHPDDVEEWRELNTRWFQFGTFVPLLRVHGERPHREMWEFGGESHPAYQAQLKFDRLRYRLLPYIYSLVGAVTHEGTAIMRPLVMDFRGDPKALGVSHEYMFGPALLVSPVTRYQARKREVYLPVAAGWYDFWTGAAAAGGATLDAPAPYDAIPIYVKAGSIVPTGPELMYTDEKPADPIVLWVYAGADGAFTLYEDDGLTYGYEKGELSRIPIRWSDATRTLSIGKREGAFPGMQQARTFEVVLVSRDQRVGFSFEPKADKRTRYDGAPVDVKL
jgi:alpha-D-xyloside xylohydrolase